MGARIQDSGGTQEIRRAIQNSSFQRGVIVKKKAIEREQERQRPAEEERGEES